LDQDDEEREREDNEIGKRGGNTENQCLTRMQARPNRFMLVLADDVGKRNGPGQIAVGRAPMFLAGITIGRRASLPNIAAPSSCRAGSRSRLRDSTSYG
jgi:hypothetical protein